MGPARRSQHVQPTLKGLHQLLCGVPHAPVYWAKGGEDGRAATLTGLFAPDARPRVARSSQPWAERCNPFGIERTHPVPQNVVALALETSATIGLTALRPARIH